jgi:hypothetical protein
MGAMPATQHMTAQEYLDLPEELQRPGPGRGRSEARAPGFELPLAELFPE